MRLSVRDLQQIVNDMVKHLPKEGKLTEEGVPTPKTNTEPFDLYGEEPLGDAVKQSSAPELSDLWYKDRAASFLQDYGGTHNFEYNWEEKLVHRFCSSLKATSGVEVDEEKLLKAVKDQIEEYEDRVLERDALKETLSWLKSKESLTESILPVLEEHVADPVDDLLESDLSPQAYIDQANKLFNIREASVPAALRKHTLHEISSDMTIPVVGRLPHSMGFRAVDEQALDAYVESWNNKQAMQGEPLKIEWTVHPDDVNKIGFRTVLK